jgi:hypothetical protein
MKVNLYYVYGLGCGFGWEETMLPFYRLNAEVVFYDDIKTLKKYLHLKGIEFKKYRIHNPSDNI